MNMNVWLSYVYKETCQYQRKFTLQCDIEGEIEYEFPIYNQIETLSGLWDSGDPRYRTTGACYGGVRLYTPRGTCHLFTSVFPYIQVTVELATSLVE